MIEWKGRKDILSLATQRRIGQLLRKHGTVHVGNRGETGPREKARKKKRNFTVELVLDAYAPTLSEIVRTGLNDVRPIGHILLVRAHDGPALQVELPLKSHGGAPLITSGPTVDALENGLQRMKASGNSHALRVLRIPSLHLSAVWAHNRLSGDSDRLIPYTTSFTGAKSGRFYTRQKIEKLIQARAFEIILRWYERQQIQKK